jgi:ring-1,2-phenylacetyl-CoA epoxidase subunit PaaC
VDNLWRFTGEMFAGDEVDDIIRDACAGPDLAAIAAAWKDGIAAILREATLTMPEDGWMDNGGRNGRHSEHLGPLIAEMQYLQRSYPGLAW